MEQKIKVAVIFGGVSGEHEVSLISAASIIKALSPQKYEVIRVGITKSGHWVMNAKIEDMIELNQASAGQAPHIGIGELAALKPLVVFPVLHGTYGEDGTIQGMLEIADLPYVGCGVMASAVGMDKVIAKRLLENAQITVTPYVTIIRRNWREKPEYWLDKVEEKLGYPCFIKPVNSGSSVGISKAKDRETLIEGINEAAKYDRKILIEAFVNAREIEVSVLGNDNPKASAVGEIVPSNEFYDYSAKYIDNKSGLHIPANLDEPTMENIRALAVKAYEALDCAGMARVDFFLDKDSGEILLNELNTIPGFTSISMYPKLWEATGLCYEKLVDELIELSLERYADKQESLKGILSLGLAK
jgi:D-alanine-D-alanine ligase